MTRLLQAGTPPPAVAAEIGALEDSLRKCDPGAATTVAFVSKMFAPETGLAGGVPSFVGFSRVFGGTLRVGDSLQARLGPPPGPPRIRAATRGSALTPLARSEHVTG
jgi:hypothetical protein